MKKTFTGNTRLFLCISGAIIVVALIMQICGVGLNLGIDFTGGSILNYSVGENYDSNDVEAILNASGYTDNQVTKAAPSAASIALQAELAAAAQADYRLGSSLLKSLMNSLAALERAVCGLVAIYSDLFSGRLVVFNCTSLPSLMSSLT